MKINVLLLGLILLCSTTFCQQITNDLSFASDMVLDEAGKRNVLLMSLKEPWKRRIEDIGGMQMDAEKNFVFYTKKDTLWTFNFNTKLSSFIPGIASFKLHHIKGLSWLVCRSSEKKGRVVFFQNLGGSKIYVDNVIDYLFDPYERGIILKVSKEINSTSGTSLIWLDPCNGIQKDFYQLRSEQKLNLKDIIFDKSKPQIAFITEDHLGRNEIWRYEFGNGNASRVLDSTILTTKFNLCGSLNSLLSFANEGKSILLFLTQENPATELPNVINKTHGVEVWSYSDPVLMPFQKMFIEKRFLMALDVSTNKIVKLENENELTAVSIDEGELAFLNYHVPNSLNGKEKIVLFQWKGDVVTDVSKSTIMYMTSEFNWNKNQVVSIFLEDVNSGSRELVRKDMKRCFAGSPLVNFSPDGRFLVFFDEEKKSYFSYNIASRELINITSKITSSLLYGNADLKTTTMHPVGIKGWANDNAHVLISDTYTDVWKVDITGEKKPLNITGELAQKYNLSIGDIPSTLKTNKGFSDTDVLVFNIVSQSTYKEGILIAKLSPNNKPYFAVDYHEIEIQRVLPDERYLVLRQTALKPPRYFLTDDFKKFVSLDVVNENLPNKIAVNKDLLKWKTFNGSDGFGLLYKPRDFNPSKKYPVLFNYYEQFSGVNSFDEEGRIFSAPGGLDFNKALEKEYLVFVPNIRYVNTNKTGLENAFNHVVSAAKYIVALPFIDRQAMALTGYSFGGHETNYIITHTGLFAAAYSSAGASDYISLYGVENKDRQGYPSTDYGGQGGQARLGVNAWLSPEILIKNSPVLFTKNVSTPVLLVANVDDYRVPSSQGIEFFKVLRRYEKKAWLLRYPSGGHSEGNDDTEVRKFQFLDHYLKSAPAPIWMTQGIPAKLKGVITGYDLDPSGNCGKDCKVCKQWNDKMKKDSGGTWKEIERRKIEEHWQ